MRVLITGIAGFIGSALARACLRRGFVVRGIDNLSTGNIENIREILDDIEFRRADLLDLSAVVSACKGCEYVFHQAAIPSVPRSVADPASSNASNVDGTLNVLLAARDNNVSRVIYAASSSAYGDTEVLPKVETMAPNPLSPYAVSKLAGEMYMKAFHRCYAMETVSLRYFNVFGPRQDPTSPYSAVLAKFITMMLEGRQPTIFGDGEQSRDFTFIDNAVLANLLACAAPAKDVAGLVFNVACGARVSLNQVFSHLQAITGYSGAAAFGPERPGDIKHSQADISLAQARLGYKPQVDVETGLRVTTNWYRERSAQGGMTAATAA